jgi:hypothetical protein
MRGIAAAEVGETRKEADAQKEGQGGRPRENKQFAAARMLRSPERRFALLRKIAKGLRRSKGAGRDPEQDKEAGPGGAYEYAIDERAKTHRQSQMTVSELIETTVREDGDEAQEAQ